MEIHHRHFPVIVNAFSDVIKLREDLIAELMQENERLKGFVEANNQAWAHGGADEYQALRRLEKAAVELVRAAGATPIPDTDLFEIRAPQAAWNALLGPVCATIELREREVAGTTGLQVDPTPEGPGRG